MSLNTDPVGDGRVKYKNKLKKDKDKAIKIYLPYYDEESGKWKLFEIPFFEIEVLEYGPRYDHPVFTDPYNYPNKGMGAPQIGAGGLSPEEEGEDIKTGGGSSSDKKGPPLPGSGQPGTPLYPPPSAGDGEGKQAGVIPIDPITGKPEEEVINVEDVFKDLELEMLKPGRISTEKGVEFSSLGYTGPESLLNWDLTIFEALNRQEMWKRAIDKKIKRLNERKEELENLYKAGKIGKDEYDEEILFTEKKIENYKKVKNTLPASGDFRISSVEREDKRYDLPRIIFKEEKGAVIIYIRDISGSINEEQLKASKKLSRAIDYWVQKFYGKKVRRIYILHNYDAWEVEEDEYYGVKESGGGTRFESAYEIVLKMFEKKDYPRKTKEKKELNHELEDIYIVQITDGFGQNDESESKLLEKIIPRITRFCYVQEKSEGYEASYKSHLENKFKEYCEKGILRTTILEGYENEHIKKSMKDLFGKRK